MHRIVSCESAMQAYSKHDLCLTDTLQFGLRVHLQGLASRILYKAGADTAGLESELDKYIANQPRVSNVSNKVHAAHFSAPTNCAANAQVLYLLVAPSTAYWNLMLHAACCTAIHIRSWAMC
jgi:hypothetical protein